MAEQASEPIKNGDGKAAAATAAGGAAPDADSSAGKPDVAKEKAGEGRNLDPAMAALSHVPVEIQVVLGTARMSIGSILNLGRGAVVEIDRKVGEQVDIQINHRPVARGEIIIVDEDRLGVTLTEIINIQAGLQ